MSINIKWFIVTILLLTGVLLLAVIIPIEIYHSKFGKIVDYDFVIRTINQCDISNHKMGDCPMDNFRDEYFVVYSKSYDKELIKFFIDLSVISDFDVGMGLLPICFYSDGMFLYCENNQSSNDIVANIYSNDKLIEQFKNFDKDIDYKFTFNDRAEETYFISFSWDNKKTEKKS